MKESLAQPDERKQKHELERESQVVAEDDRRQIQPKKQSYDRAQDGGNAHNRKATETDTQSERERQFVRAYSLTEKIEER